MKCWHLNLDSLDSVSANESNLSVSALLERGFAELERYEPLNLSLNLRICWINCDAWNVKAAQSVAGGVATRIDSLYFLKGNVRLSHLTLQWAVVARAHLCMRVVAWVCELVASACRVEELNCLVTACSHNQLRLWEVTDVKDRGVVGCDPLVARHGPGWAGLEEFDEVSLEVPDEDLTRSAFLSSGLVPLVIALLALLELVGGWDRGIRWCWIGALWWSMWLLIQVLLTSDQAAALSHVAHGRRILVLVSLQLCQELVVISEQRCLLFSGVLYGSRLLTLAHFR